MTRLIVAAFGVCAGALVALGRAVVSLRSEVDSVSRRVDALSGTALPPAAVVGSTATADTAAIAAAASDPADSEVPAVLITDIADERLDTEPTASRVSVTLAGPLIKVAALASGLKHALREEGRMRISFAFRHELKSQRKLRRHPSASRAASQGWRP